jgi:hypothetical protein
MNTPNSWSETGFEVEFTEDGSPSLRQRSSAIRSDQKGESMHHSGGAFSETELIYAGPIRRALPVLKSPHFVSVGLGLGYVELVIARECLRAGQSDFTLDSWESEACLRNAFRAWIFSEPLAPEIRAVYDRVAEFVLRDAGIDVGQIQKNLQEKYESKAWQIRPALLSPHPTEPMPRRANGVLFDAFSAKTTPELWTEEFLSAYFTENLAEDSFVSTYASRTTLKKALRQSGFQILVREGFKGKRNSTLAFKGTLSAIFAPVEIS